MNSNGSILTSPAPFQDDLKKYNVLYPIFIVVGIIVGLIGDATWYMMGLVGLVPAGLIKSAIATKMTYDLQKRSFELPYKITGVELCGVVTIPLTQLGMLVNVENGETVATYLGMQYTLRIYSDGTFGFLFDHSSTASRALLGRRYIGQYKKAIVAMGLIAYIVQDEMRKRQSRQDEPSDSINVEGAL